MRLTIALALVPLAVAVMQADARATGLSASLSPSDGSLGRLDSLSVDVRLGPSTAEITQQRSYALNSMYAGAPVELTFYDSVTGPAGTAPPAITINGLPVTGTTLAVADADAARRRLTRLLGDPTALRGLGTPLYATDAMVVQVPTTNVIDVRITTTVPLAMLGTMRGLVVPLDWSRLPVAKVDVKVTATTAAPLRALYSPYHELQVVRDDVGAAHASYTGHNVCTDFDLTLLVSERRRPRPPRPAAVPLRPGRGRVLPGAGDARPDPGRQQRAAARSRIRARHLGQHERRQDDAGEGGAAGRAAGPPSDRLVFAGHVQ